MAHPTALPLTQQVMAWTLQGLGLLDHLSGLSRSSAKNALGGQVVSAAWEKLVDELLAVLGTPGQPQQREALGAALHEADRWISRLDAMDLDLLDRMPPVVRSLIPHVGARFGAAAAIIDQGIWVPPREEEGRLLPVADWLCDPLSASTFGRVAEVVLRGVYPTWTGWGQVAEDLERRGVASRKTVARWRSEELYVPNVANVNALAQLVPEGAGRSRALLALRTARLLTATRRALSKDWGDAVLAQETALAVASWARVTREALGQPGVLADLADNLALTFESPLAGHAYAHRSPLMQAVVPADSAAALALRLRYLASEVRRTSDGGQLRWLAAEQVMTPHPLLCLAVGVRLGATNPLQLLAGDAGEIVQHSWRFAAFLRAVANGEGLHFQPSGSTEKIPFKGSEALRAQAHRLLDRGRRIVRPSDDEREEDMEYLQFAAMLAAESGGTDALMALPEAWNSAFRRVAVPAAMEIVATPEVMDDSPHLAAYRARRLANEGADADAFGCIARWRALPGIKLWEERVAVADALITIGHRHLDRHAPLRASLTQLQGLEAKMPGALTATVTAALATCRGVLLQAHTGVSALLQAAGDALHEAPDSAGRAARATLLLPFAIRVGALGRSVGASNLDAERLASELEASLRALPTDGDSWAVLALWQACEGRDSSFAERQAVHFGAATTYRRLREVFARDGLLDLG